MSRAVPEIKMRFLFAILFVTFTASSSFAQVLCQTIGIQTFCSNGQVFQNFGNQSTTMTYNDGSDLIAAGIAAQQADRNALAAGAMLRKYGPEYMNSTPLEAEQTLALR